MRLDRKRELTKSLFSHFLNAKELKTKVEKENKLNNTSLESTNEDVGRLKVQLVIVVAKEKLHALLERMATL